jgi:mRNA interferase RelE/StbE
MWVLAGCSTPSSCEQSTSGSRVTPPAHRLLVAATAERSLARLPESPAAAIVEFTVGALVENPRRVGHPIQRELAGLWAARRGPYRVVYEINDDEKVVTVLRIDHRADVYRRR